MEATSTTSSTSSTNNLGLLYPGLQRNALWGYLFAVLLTVIFAYILGGFNNNFDTSNLQGIIPDGWSSLIWILALVFLALGVYYATFCVDLVTAGVINSLLVLQLLFFIAWFIVFQRFGDFTSAFWAAIILLVLALATLFFLWQAGAYQASFFVIIYLIWLGYALWLTWQYLQQNGQRLF